MKNSWNLAALLLTLIALSFAPALNAQEVEADSTGLPGDHFSLEGALELFKKAESPEAFEKLLNDADNYVNNLDLNEDGEVDYIRVEDRMEGDVHAIVLQVPVSESESQDVAVIEIEKTGAEEAILQILGDEDVFGETRIVEPFEVEEQPTGKGGPNGELLLTRVAVNVYFWPSVRYVYAPGYRVWVSPFRWAYYPRWWSPWRPYSWRVWHPHVVAYRPHYHVVTTHRVVHAHRVYTPHRTYSKTVRTRTVTTKSRRGGPSVSKSTTTVTGPRGRSATKSTTKVEGRNGNVKGRKSTTTVRGQQGQVKGRKSTTTVRKERPNNKKDRRKGN